MKFIYLFYEPVLNIAIKKGNNEIIKLLINDTNIDVNFKSIIINFVYSFIYDILI